MNKNSETESRCEQLLDMIGQLPEEMVAAAAPAGKRKRRRTRGLVTAAAACLVCACAVGFGAWRAGWFDTAPEIEKHPHGEESRNPEIASPEPAPWRPWETLPMGERYPYLTWNGRSYAVQTPLVDGAEIGEALGAITVHGYHEQTEEDVELQATLHRLQGVSEQFAVAVVFPDTEGELPETPVPYVYADTSWQPATLGELIEGLNLEEFMDFGIVYDGDDHHVMYEVPDADIWALMLTDRTLENVYDESRLSTKGYGNHLISVSVNIRELGYWNISMSVTDAGYLFTNIGSTGKAFYLGEGRANEIATVLAGYERIEQPGDESLPEVPTPEDEPWYEAVEEEPTPVLPDEGATTAPYDPRA